MFLIGFWAFGVTTLPFANLDHKLTWLTFFSPSPSLLRALSFWVADPASMAKPAQADAASRAGMMLEEKGFPVAIISPGVQKIINVCFCIYCPPVTSSFNAVLTFDCCSGTENKIHVQLFQADGSQGRRLAQKDGRPDRNFCNGSQHNINN